MNTTTDVAAIVTRILAEQLGITEEDIAAADKLEDLDADSLDRVEIVMALEDEFGIQIPDEDAQPLDTVGKIIDYVKGKVRA